MRVVITGDSTASDYPADRAPRTGWGQALASGFDLEVRNHARPGASTRSFIDLGLFDAAITDLRSGDVLLICFGHNDPKPDERYSSPDDFVSHLRLFLIAARDRGATPVLLTPIERRRFAGNELETTHGEYPDRVRAVARDEDVALIDLTRETHALWQSQGREGSKLSFLWLTPGSWPGYPEGEQDDTHLSAVGAALVAALVAEGLVEVGIAASGDIPAGART